MKTDLPQTERVHIREEDKVREDLHSGGLMRNSAVVLNMIIPAFTQTVLLATTMERIREATMETAITTFQMNTGVDLLDEDKKTFHTTEGQEKNPMVAAKWILDPVIVLVPHRMHESRVLTPGLGLCLALMQETTH